MVQRVYLETSVSNDGVLQFADVSKVDKGGLLGAHSNHLGWLHHKFPLLPSDHVWVLLTHDVEDPV